MRKPLFIGCSTALITPITPDNKIDWPALESLIERQIKAGVKSLTILGTTSEYITLSKTEIEALLAFAVKVINKRVFVICGTGSNSTAETLEMSKMAESYGVDALLIVTPYYNKTSQAGLIAHYTYLADNLKTPIILYNVPSRTGMSFTADTYYQLSKHPNIYGTKDASSNLGMLIKTKALCGDDFYIYSGNDDQILPILSIGGSGVISVISNIVPADVEKMCTYYFENQLQKATQLQVHYCELIEGLFCEVSPIPAKYIMSRLGLCHNILRLPLLAFDKHERIDQLIQKYNLLSEVCND